MITPLRTAVLALALAGALAAQSRAARPLPGAEQGTCPHQRPQPLPGDALIGATAAALGEAPSLYRETDLRGMRATEAVLATFNAPRGGYASKCGGAVRARTVVVYLEFPAMRPSASLSEGVLLVGRFGGTYRVWARLH